MLSNPLTEHKKAISEIRSIFSFTEIRQKRGLPSVKSASGFRSQKSVLNSTQSTWRDFLRRNLSPRQVTAPTKELFDLVESRVRQEFKSNPISIDVKSLASNKDLEVFKLSILNKKNLFNKVHDTLMKKERVLEGLLNKYEELSILELEMNDQEILEQKNLECEEVEIGLSNEIIYQQTLNYMAGRLKKENLEISKPLIGKQQKLAEIRTELKNLQSYVKTHEEKIAELDKNFESISESFHELIEKKTSLMNEKSKIYEEKIKLKLSIDQEKDKNSLKLKQKQDEKRLKDLEDKLAEFRNVELLEAEILTFEEFCVNEEEKFKKIQKVTNIRKVGEILEHYDYLMGNKEKLMENLQFSFQQIEKLHDERVKLNDELNFLRFLASGDEGFIEVDVEEIEKGIDLKNKDLEDYEVKVQELEKILVFAVNTFARVSKALGLERKLGKIRNSNLENCIKAVVDAFNNFEEPAELDSAQVREEEEFSVDSCGSSDVSYL